MKNAFIILILFVFLFYIIGYKIIFLGLQYQADRAMEHRLETDSFSKAQTIILKIPLSLPYKIFTRGYQDARGTFEHRGEFYHLVKQKIEADTLYVICLKDEYKALLNARMTDFEKAVNNWPLTSGKTTSLLKTFVKDYLSGDPVGISGDGGWIKEILFSPIDCKVINRACPPVPPPPKKVSGLYI